MVEKHFQGGSGCDGVLRQVVDAKAGNPVASCEMYPRGDSVGRFQPTVSVQGLWLLI